MSGREQLMEKINRWFYGGQDKSFFSDHKEAIHEYNAGITHGFLTLMPCVLGVYLILSLIKSNMHQFTLTYLISIIFLVFLLIWFEDRCKNDIMRTNLCTSVLLIFMYIFVCHISTSLNPKYPAVMFIVFLLTVPMLYIIPLHYLYSCLMLGIVIFTVIDVHVKDSACLFVDTSHTLTVFVIGLFIGHHILKSRISLLAANERLDHLSKYDSLTDLPNRHGLNEYISSNISPDTSLLAAIIDIDDFKKYNDTYGHLEGDRILVFITRILREHTESNSGYAVRFGGEEFLWLDTVHCDAEFFSILDAFRNDIYSQNIINSDSTGGRITLSIGFARKEKDEDISSLLKRADNALYDVKGNGKNQVRFYSLDSYSDPAPV